MAERIESVLCRDVHGRLREIRLTDHGAFVTPGSALQQRLVVAHDQRLVRKFVPRAAGARDPRLYELLDNEVRAGTRLGQVYSGSYPAELARLVAYNMDVEEPFVLLRAYPGLPAADQVKGFDDAERREFQIGLLRALQLTAAAGVVHGAIGLTTVRWADNRLQLVDFESAERVGEPRRAGGGSRGRSPEQAAGLGEVDARDDLWAAGLLIRAAYPGTSANGSAPDRSHDPERLRALLDGVFDHPLEQRPTPADLLLQLRADQRVPPPGDPEAGLIEGRRLFEQICVDKRGPATSPPARGTDPDGRVKRKLPFLATVAVIAVVLIIGMVVLV
ncbi:hypothetical protein [Amycolatopsis sp. DG1A-15b]|uniref:hypothetical protein n=1 Tax=Amycolatopsis sp. DG1A-15b TaxID=3052846 RepID=UPI00255B95BE|nr:hypothetical protein [Amycolatopsis sp. DG1A-15b]WIX92967.1 hypothetical protein QRY02_22025 [Amycolatopsis sp. DG1A-15b]